MCKLQAITPAEKKDGLLQAFTRLGCVEIKSVTETAAAETVAAHVPTADPQAAAHSHELAQALDILQRYRPEKRSMLMPKPRYTEREFYERAALKKATETAATVLEIGKMLAALQAERLQLAARREYLGPWLPSDLPLQLTGGRHHRITHCTCPASTELEPLQQQLAAEIPLAAAEQVNTDKEQRYLLFVYHIRAEEQMEDLVKQYHLTKVTFKDEQGSAAACLEAVEREAVALDEREALLFARLDELKPLRPLLELAYDRQNLQSQQESLAAQMLATGKTVYFEAWLPQKQQQAVSAILDQYGCAYEFSDADLAEEPPVLLENSKLVRPFSAITELYGLPAYGSRIDPNPTVAFFFFLFFGMMLGDAMYGLILAAGTFYFLKKAQPTGSLQKFLTVACAVGISTVIAGALFSSWFGNFPQALGAMLGRDWNIPPILFTPIEEPIQMLILALAIGVINLFVGMGLSAWRMIKEGHVFSAIFDIGFWYLILIGLIAWIAGYLGGNEALLKGIYIAATGAVGVLLTAGRAKKNIFSKLLGGLSSLYGVTSYLSDILSYSRLMALGLATGVVAEVLNTMGSLAGNGVLGWILFIIVFFVGQAFNMAIGLLGAFVHSCRLIYVEFFGKFFESGGRAFAPLRHQTKYIQVVKEDN